MNKIVGGLLVAALLTKPSLFAMEFFTYEVYKSQYNITALIKRHSAESELLAGSADIDGILKKIDQNKRDIVALSKVKQEVCGGIEKAITLKAVEKICMTEDQMCVYKQFYDFYDGELASLNDTVAEMDEEQILKGVQREIIKDDSDIGYVFEQLKAIDGKQTDIICKLNGIIEIGSMTLAVL